MGTESPDLELLLAEKLGRRLAQGPSPDEAVGSGETILAGFPASAPESVEEDVAKAHALEIVRRFTIESLDTRIVVYRAKDARTAADVVAALKQDLRVASAQVNMRYGLQQRAPPQDAADRGKKASARDAARQAKVRPAAPDRKNRISETPPGTGHSDAAPGAMAARSAPPPLRPSQRQGSLVTSKQAALRWPTADEPFVNVGVTNK